MYEKFTMHEIADKIKNKEVSIKDVLDENGVSLSKEKKEELEKNKKYLTEVC